MSHLIYLKGCKMHAPTCARSVGLQLPPHHAASASLSVCPFGVFRLGRFCRDTSATVLPDRVFPAGTCAVQERRYISHKAFFFGSTLAAQDHRDGLVWFPDRSVRSERTREKSGE